MVVQQAQLEVDMSLIGHGRMLIGGQWVNASTGETRDIVDPGTGRVVAQVTKAGEADVEAAVAAARQAFDDGRWTGLSGQQRAVVLWKVSDLMEANLEALAVLESINMGAPLSQTRLMVGEAINQFRYFAGWADKIHGKTVDIGPAGRRLQGYTLREPMGVAGLIVSWNAPLMGACQKLAPALAAGCSCILKPAELTPLTALALARLLHEAGVPDGVVNVVTGSGSQVGAALAAHPDIDKISFTGSTEVGRAIVKAGTGNLKKLSLELGGKSPVVVMRDADIASVVQGVATGVFWNTGQVCTAGTRLIAHRDIYEEVVKGIAEVGRSLQLGYATDPNTDLGPLVSSDHRESVSSFVDDGINAGARLVSGGSRVEGQGYFFEPTVIADVDPAMRIAQEEIFGPVLTATPFSDADEAVVIANDTKYGLAGSVWTRDVSLAHNIARKLRAGRVGINVHRAGGVQMPVGGYRQSGWGRENGFEAIEEYLEVKSVISILDRP